MMYVVIIKILIFCWWFVVVVVVVDFAGLPEAKVKAPYKIAKKKNIIIESAKHRKYIYIYTLPGYFSFKIFFPNNW